MNYSRILLVLLISISVIFNVVTFNKIDDLNIRLDYLQVENQQIKSSINSVPSYINNFLNQVKEIESWITPVQIDVENIESNQMNLKARWQIKDFDPSSTIRFHYQIEGEEFKDIEVVSKGQGYFEAELSLDLKLQPEWIVEIQGKELETEGIEPNQRTVRVVKAEKQDNDNLIKYYVSVESKDNIKSSEMVSDNLNRLANVIYGMLQVDMYINNHDMISVSLNNFNAMNTKQRITNAALKVFKNGQIIHTENLEPSNHREGAVSGYHVTYQNTDKEFNQLVLEVKYDNGRTFKKEILTR